MSLPVLTAITGAWEAPLVAGLERFTAEVRVARRCVDLADLLAAAASGLGRAAVLSADLYRLDREALVLLARSGVAVVGLVDPADEEARRRWEALGVERILPADAEAARIAAALLDAAQDLPRHRDLTMDGAPTASDTWGTADPADALAPAPPTMRSASPDDPGRYEAAARGRLIAVWGPTGAPGRTTVAVSLAGELAARGAQTLLVDADTYGPSVAQTLGMLDESGGIAGAVRSANAGDLDLARLARLSPCISSTLRVLTGLPQPSRWPELRPTSLDVVWERARQLARWTVVDCGFALETDEELSYDSAAPRRNGATLSAVTAADLVLVVGTADPVGLQRLVRGIAEITDTVGPALRYRAVVTRVRASSVGKPPERRIEDALSRFAGVRAPWLIPDDRPACDAAMLAGRMLIELAPGSPARRAFADLALDLEEAVVREELHASG